MRRYTIFELFNIAKDSNESLLPLYTADFWTEYIVNSTKFDRLFLNLYRTFYTYNDYDDNDVLSEFKLDIESLFEMNEKKYSELYRVNIIDDNKYGILDNYDLNESYSESGNFNIGERNDTSSQLNGTQTSTIESNVSGFNSDQFNPDNLTTSITGDREDIVNISTGAQENTSATEHVLRRFGNIGVSTQTDVMKKHYDFWNVYEFYKIIFEDINLYLLCMEEERNGN